jgi:hypothetical protein
MTLIQATKRKPKRKPKSKKTNGPKTNGPKMNGPKGTSMNGPKTNSTKGISLNENHPLKTFKTRKTNAMRKRGLNFKGNPLGTSLNFRPKLSLKNLIQQRRNQDQKNNRKNSQKNQKKTKGFKDRKKNALAKILENMKESKERNTALRELKKATIQEEPNLVLDRSIQLAEREEREEKEQNFDNLFDGLHDKQHLNTKGMNVDVSRGLMMASRKAELSNYHAMKKIDDIQRNQTEPKNNSNFPDFRGKLAKR